ncbi:MAG: Hsp70 family protein [Chloroflexota bacterium]|nr:Hsp70 family protein [Chloroflexota bacterium]MDE3193494.1 Hsp70 family protein [Chloroflexota bacterium]
MKSTRHRFGLDFGTSNTSLAVADGSSARVLPIDPVVGATMPTLLYVRRDASTYVGRPAIDLYLADQRERGPIRREVKLLGVALPSSDNKSARPVEAHILADLSSPGRLFRSLKSFLGSSLDPRTSVFGSEMSLTGLVAIVLEHVRRRAVELTGEEPSSIRIGRPVEFVGGPSVEAMALARLEEAARLAGFRGVAFEPEPVAAARAASVGEGNTLVFDFGGGTLDLAITHRSGSDVRVVATAGRGVAGDRFTQVLIDLLVAPHLGAGVTWGEKRLRLPAFITGAISDWHQLSALNEKAILDALDDLVRAGAPRRELSALRSAIELQLGYEIFAAVDAVKIELSGEDVAVFAFHHDEVDVDAVVPRRRFELRARPLLDEIDALVSEVLARADLAAADVAEVVLTGGSSALPAARALVARRFPGAARRDHAAFSSVALGLALGG